MNERTALSASGARGRWPAWIFILAALTVVVGGCRRSRPKLTRGDGGIVVDETRPAAGGPPVQVEAEPAAGEALAVHFAPSGGFVFKGTLGPTDIEDTIQVSIPGTTSQAGDAGVVPTQQLALTIAPGAGFATSLAAVGADAQPIFRSSGAAGAEHGVPNLAVAAGQRLSVVVRLQSKPTETTGGAYTLTGQLSELGAADEREPNGAAAAATMTRPAHTSPELAGFLSARDDADWFRIPVGEASEGTVIGLTLEPPADLAASLAVSDQAGVRLQTVRGRKGRPVSLRQLAPQRVSTGGAPGQPPAFLIEVRSEGSGDRQHRYVLRVWSEESPAGEREPNDDTAHAHPLPDGETTGYLTPGDVDHFRFEGQTGQTVVVTLSPPGRTDVVLETLATGQARWTRVDAQRRGQPETLSLTPPAAGPILVKVGSKGDAQTGDEPYRILLERR